MMSADLMSDMFSRVRTIINNAKFMNILLF